MEVSAEERGRRMRAYGLVMGMIAVLMVSTWWFLNQFGLFEQGDELPLGILVIVGDVVALGVLGVLFYRSIVLRK